MPPSSKAYPYRKIYKVYDNTMNWLSKLSTKDVIQTVALERIASGVEANPAALAAEALHLARHCKDKGFEPYFKFQKVKTIDVGDL